MFEKLFGKKQPPPLPDDPEELAELSDSLTDPWERRRCVDKALSLAPDSLTVLRTALMLGELGTVPRSKADMRQIKCWILTPLEKPDDFDEAERRRLIREIFDHPLLKKCLSVCGDPEAFMERYIQDLVRQYCSLFIASSSAHSGEILGFSTARSRLRGISAPMADMLENTDACPFLTEEEKALLLGRMAPAFRDFTGGDLSRIRELVGPEMRGKLRILLNDEEKKD